MKSTKVMISLALALVALAAAAWAVIVFKDEIFKAFSSCKDFCTSKLGKKDSEFSDFADV